MKLTSLLVKIGLVHGALDGSAPAAETLPPLATRRMNLEELRRQDREEEGRGLMALLELDKSFAEIYRESGIGEPPAGVRLEELDRLVADLSPEEARLAVLAALKEKGAPVREVLLDGQRRDQVLDAFEQELEQRVEAESRALGLRAEDLERQARDLEAQARELKARVPELERALKEWKKRKHEEEDLMELLGSMLVSFPEEPPQPAASEEPQAGGGAGPTKPTSSES